MATLTLYGLSVAASCPAPRELGDDRLEQGRARAPRLGAPGDRRGKLIEYFGDLSGGLHLGHHLPVIGRRPEELRVERKNCRYLGPESLGELGLTDLRTLRHSHLVEHEPRALVVGAGLAQEIVEVLG